MSPKYLALGGTPGTVVASAETLDEARTKVHALARVHSVISIVEVKARFITQAVAREVQDEGTVKRLMAPA